MNAKTDGRDLFIPVEPDLETALDAGGVGIWRWKVGSADLGWTRNLEAIHRLPDGTFDGTFGSFSRDIDEGDLARVMATIEQSIATRTPYEIRYRNRPAAGVDPIWIEARGSIVESPGGDLYMTGVCQNATDRIVARMQLERRLAQQQAVSELGTYALSEDDFEKVLERAVEVTARILDVPRASVLELSGSAETLSRRVGYGWPDGIGEVVPAGPTLSQAGYALATGMPVLVDDVASETRFAASPLLLAHGVKSSVSVLVAGDEGRPFGVLSAHSTVPRRFDRSDADFLLSVSNIVANSARQARVSDRRRIIIREMAHRSGNMFQLMLSLFNQTVATAEPERAADLFRARLMTLSSANLLLAGDGWTRTGIRGLLETTLQPFADRLSFDGPNASLPADLAFDLSLVFHELATNSAKYGALATSEGKADIAWRVDAADGAPTLHFDWTDRAPGANPSAAAKGTGFGSKLIGLLVERKWGGSYGSDDIEFYRFTCSIPMPADIVEA